MTTKLIEVALPLDAIKAAAQETKTLGALRDRGFLEMIGSGRIAWYTLGPKCRSVPDLESVQTGLDLIGSAAEPITSTDNPISSSTQSKSFNGESGSSGVEASKVSSQASMVSSQASTIGSPASTVASGASTIGSRASSVDLWTELERLADHVRGRRSTPPHEMRSAILALCMVTPLSVQEIARLVGRGASHIGPVHVKPLVDAGHLVRLFPDQPRHPNQKYATTPSGHNHTVDTGDTEGDRT